MRVWTSSGSGRSPAAERFSLQFELNMTPMRCEFCRRSSGGEPIHPCTNIHDVERKRGAKEVGWGGGRVAAETTTGGEILATESRRSVGWRGVSAGPTNRGEGGRGGGVIGPVRGRPWDSLY
jgi:hypothetical protein